MRNKRGSNVDKLTVYTGLGLRMAGDGKMRPAVMPRRKIDLEEIKKNYDETR